MISHKHSLVISMIWATLVVLAHGFGSLSRQRKALHLKLSSSDDNNKGFGKNNNNPKGFSSSSSSSPPATQRKQPKLSPASQFALQEMKINLSEMQKQNVPSRYLPIEKRDEIESYVRTVATTIPSPSDFVDSGGEGKWKLVFSTDGATMGDLPNGASVSIEFGSEEKLDYVLNFEKTWGLKSLVAKCTYKIEALSNNQSSLLTFTYDEIVTDAFGFNNLPVGLFGLLKGRTNVVETVWYDDTYWIDYGYSPDGSRDYFNVYVRVDDD